MVDFWEGDVTKQANFLDVFKRLIVFKHLQDKNIQKDIIFYNSQVKS